MEAARLARFQGKKISKSPKDKFSKKPGSIFQTQQKQNVTEITKNTMCWEIFVFHMILMTPKESFCISQMGQFPESIWRVDRYLSGPCLGLAKSISGSCKPGRTPDNSWRISGRQSWYKERVKFQSGFKNSLKAPSVFALKKKMLKLKVWNWPPV